MPATIEKRNYEWPLATTWDGFFTQDKPGGTTQRVPKELVLNTLNSSGWLVRSIESFRESGFSDTQTIEAAAASGVTVWFPSGTWTLTGIASDTVTMASNTFFIGSGYSTRIVSAIRTNPITFATCNHSGIKDMRLDFSRVTGGGYTSACLTYQGTGGVGPKNIHIENVDFECVNIFGERFFGVDAEGANVVKHKDCRYTLPAEQGFHVFMAGRTITTTYAEGNGSTTAFDTTFAIAANTDVAVYVAGRLKTLTTDYTVSIHDSIATITFVTAPASGAVIDFALRVSSAIASNSFVGTTQGVNGSNKEFPTSFIVPFNDAIKVYVDNVLKTLTTHYTVSSTGSRVTVTFVTAPALGTTVRLDLVAGPQFQTITTSGHTNVSWHDCEFNGGSSGFLGNADNLSITHCTFTSVLSPIAVTFSKGFKCTHNTFLDFTGNGITCGNGTNDIIQGYDISDNFLYSERNTLHGINIYKSGGNYEDFPTNYGKTKRGVIGHNQIYGVSGNSGIFLYSNGFTTVSTNTIEGFGTGIQANCPTGGTHPGNFTIQSNQIKAFERGIAIGTSDSASNGMHDAIVKGNVIDAPRIGFYCANGNNIQLEGNTFTGLTAYDAGSYTGVGVQLNYVTICNIKNNTVIGTGNVDFWWQLNVGAIVVVEGNIWSGEYRRIGYFNPLLGTNDPVFINNRSFGGLSIDSSSLDPVMSVMSKASTYHAEVNWQGGVTSSQNRSGMFLVSFSAHRGGSSTWSTQHAHAVAIIGLARAAGSSPNPNRAGSYTTVYDVADPTSVVVTVGGVTKTINVDYTSVAAGTKAKVDFLLGHVPAAGDAIVLTVGGDSTTFTAATEKWTVLSTVYLYQYGGSPTITVTTLGDTVTFTGSTSATSADSAVISVQPFVGGLVSNIIGEVI